MLSEVWRSWLVCARLVFLACLLFSVVLVLIGWVIPASWSLASLPHVSLLPVFPSRLLSGSCSECSLVICVLLPCLDAYGGMPWGVYVLSFSVFWWWLTLTAFQIQKGLCKLSWL